MFTYGDDAISDDAFHLRSYLGDLIRLADIARGLRILFAFEIPCNGALCVQGFHVTDVGCGLLEYPGLELCQSGRCSYIEIICIAVIEVTSRVVGVTPRLVHVSLRRTGEIDSSYRASIRPVQLHGPSLRPILIGIHCKIGRGGARGGEA